MNYYEKFKKDLKDGELGEKVFAFYLKEKMNFDIVGFNHDYKYDVVAELFFKRITFEIKTDRYEYLKKTKTDNMFIEVSCNNKPSGISKTEADVFVYFLPDFEEAYMIKVSTLKDLIIQHPEYFRYTTQSGDGGKVRGYLINRYKFSHLFKCLKVPKLKCWNKPASDV
jgi:hypothetical protein